MKLPFVIIFDIDKTVIGDVNYCTKEWAVLQEIYKKCILDNKDGSCFNMAKMDITEELKGGLLRPNVNDFIAYCDKKFKNVEVFFFTNSGHNWANSIVVPNIEKALGFKANRPIFTREHSVDFTKTISNIYPFIFKALTKNYPAVKKEQVFAKVLNERMIFIDDIKDNVHDYKQRQIQCPEYNTRTFYDIPEKIITKYGLPPSVFDNKDVLKVMDDKFVPIYNKNGSEYQQDKEFACIQYLYMSKLTEISKKKKDTFFLDLISKLEKVDTLTDKEIAKINKAFITT